MGGVRLLGGWNTNKHLLEQELESPLQGSGGNPSRGPASHTIGEVRPHWLLLGTHKTCLARQGPPLWRAGLWKESEMLPRVCGVFFFF